jgi:hypothetical protein
MKLRPLACHWSGLVLILKFDQGYGSACAEFVDATLRQRSQESATVRRRQRNQSRNDMHTAITGTAPECHSLSLILGLSSLKW